MMVPWEVNRVFSFLPNRYAGSTSRQHSYRPRMKKKQVLVQKYYLTCKGGVINPDSMLCIGRMAETFRFLCVEVVYCLPSVYVAGCQENYLSQRLLQYN
jgi:hypothetical protein